MSYDIFLTVGSAIRSRTMAPVARGHTIRHSFQQTYASHARNTATRHQALFEVDARIACLQTKLLFY